MRKTAAIGMNDSNTPNQATVACRSACVEQWRLHGAYELDGRRRLFALDLRRSDAGGVSGHALTLTILVDGEDRPQTISRADAAWVEMVRRRDKLLMEGRADRHMGAAVWNDFDDSRAPIELEVLDDVRFEDPSSLESTWGDVEIRGGDTSISLAFRDPTIGTIVRLAWPIVAAASSSGAETANGASETILTAREAGDAKNASTSLSIEHRVDRSPVAEDEDPCPRRAQLAARLADGRAMIIDAIRPDSGSEPSQGLCRLGSGEANSWSTVAATLEPIRHWTSRRTITAFPIAWRITAPAIGLAIEFHPTTDDQEVACFGIERSRWDGAGRIEGTVEGVPISTEARLRLEGDGVVESFRAFTQANSRAIYDRISTAVPRRFDERILSGIVSDLVDPADLDHEVLTREICDPFWDLLDRGGKHWRPIAIQLLCESMSIPASLDPLFTCLTEVFHDACLIIDDIEDGSATRRGGPSIHLSHGLGTAINAANACYFLPMMLLDDPRFGLSIEQRAAAHAAFVRWIAAAHLGQALDLGWSRSVTPDELRRRLDAGFDRQILAMYKLKSGAIGAAQVNLILTIRPERSEVRPRLLESLGKWAETFQIVDDTLNFIGGPGWTRPLGEDLAQGKLTWVVVRALMMLEGPARDRLIEILCDPELRNDPGTHAEGLALVTESGAIQHALTETRRSVQQIQKQYRHDLRASLSATTLQMVLSGLLQSTLDY